MNEPNSNPVVPENNSSTDANPSAPALDKKPPKNSKRKGLLKGASEYNQFILFVVVAILLMVASNLFFFKIDLTASNLYSLSPVSKKLVANLVMPLQVKVFFSKELPPPHNSTEKYLRDLLNEYNAAGNRHFSYRFYDCSVDKESSSEAISDNIKEANSYNIYPVKLQDIEKDKVQVKLAYMGLVVQHGDMIERMPSINDVYALEYRITQIINKMNNKVNFLAGLENKIDVRLLLSSSLEPIAPHINIKAFSGVPNRIREAVNAANKRNYQKIDFVYGDPSKDPSVEEQASQWNLEPYSFRWRRNNQEEVLSGYAHLVIRHENKAEVIKLIKSVTLPLFGTQYSFENLDALEEKLNNLIDTMLDINDKIAYISNKGSLDLETAPPRGFTFQGSEDGDGANFNRMLSKLYSIQSIDADELTKDYKALIIAGAKEAFTDWELFLIDQFLLSGRSVIVFHDAFRQITNQQQGGFMGQQLPTYEPLQTGLEDLLAHYGLLAKKELVLDLNAYEQALSQQQGGGIQPIYFVPRLLQEGINKGFIAFKGINELYMNRPSLVELDDEKVKTQDLKTTQLLTSSPKSWTLKDRITLVPSYLVPPREEEKMQSHSLAYLLEGKFSSYFAEKGVPVKTDDNEDDDTSEKTSANDITLGSESFLKEGKPAKLFVMGTSGNINNEIVAREGELAPNPIIRANAAFVMNLIDYMNNKKDWALMRAKGSMRNPLTPYDETSNNWVHRVLLKPTTLKNFNIYALPVVMIFVGLLFYLRRRAKKRRLQLLFSK